MVFREYSNIAISTTLAFLGLLAGRELALSVMGNARQRLEALAIAGRDFGKTGIGLAVSMAAAFSLPILSRRFHPIPDTREAETTLDRERDVAVKS